MILRGVYTFLAKVFDLFIAMILGKISPNINTIAETTNTSIKIKVDSFQLCSFAYSCVIYAAKDAIATFAIVLPVRIDTNKRLGWAKIDFNFLGVESLFWRKWKYAVSEPEKNAEKINKKIRLLKIKNKFAKLIIKLQLKWVKWVLPENKSK